jgi:hypothetical protein
VINELIFLVEDGPSGGCSAKALGVGAFTQGGTRDELSANVREAVEVYFDKPDEMPRLIRLHYVINQNQFRRFACEPLSRGSHN